jgi:cytochrome c6
MKWNAERKIRLLIPGLFAGLALVLFMAMPAGTHAASATKGQELFKSNCAVCHGPDGKGQTAMGKMMKLKDLGSEEVQKMSDAEIHETIVKGKKAMRPFGNKLNKEQIDDLVAYIRELGKKEKK